MTTKDKYKLEQESSNKIVSGNVLKVMMALIVPIFLYNLLNFGYGVYDTLMVSVAGIGKVESIVVFNEIKKTIATVSSALITGGIILISRNIGKLENEKANTMLTTLFYSLFFVSLFLLVVIIPFSPAFLALIQTPKEIISSSLGYFIVSVLCIVLEMFNSLFIGVQKVKGKTSIIFYLNIGVIFIKLLLSTIFAFGGIKGVNETWLVGATFIAQLFMFVFAIRSLTDKKSFLKVSKPKINFKMLKEILVISLPIFVGDFLFHYTKVFINSKVSIFYGVATITALGIAQIPMTFYNAFINSISTVSQLVISQNSGAGKFKRVFEAFKWSVILCVICAVAVFALVTIFAKPLMVALSGKNTQTITASVEFLNIIKIEMFFTLLLTVSVALLNGLAKTKHSMLIKILRTVVLRIPLLYLFVFVFKANYKTPAYILITSNGITAIVVLIITVVYVLKNKSKFKDLSFKKEIFENTNELVTKPEN